MEKTLSIIIPHFKETRTEMFPLISSIDNQLGVIFEEIEVVIVNDGPEAVRLGSDFTSEFNNLDIREITLKKNSGPGIARQAGIDAAVGKYVMFCDADDILHNIGVLNTINQVVKDKEYDAISTNWLEEGKDAAGENFTVLHEFDSTWMFGKVIRKAFLEEHGIRHHNRLRVHEDSYFLALVFAFAKVHTHIDIISYVWRNNAKSITRKNNGIYRYDSIPVFIYAVTEAEKFLEDKDSESGQGRILNLVSYIYFMLHEKSWSEKENAIYKMAAETAFRQCMAPLWHYWLEAPYEQKTQEFNSARIHSNYHDIEEETLYQWLHRLKMV